MESGHNPKLPQLFLNANLLLRGNVCLNVAGHLHTSARVHSSYSHGNRHSNIEQLPNDKRAASLKQTCSSSHPQLLSYMLWLKHVY